MHTSSSSAYLSSLKFRQIKKGEPTLLGGWGRGGGGHFYRTAELFRLFVFQFWKFEGPFSLTFIRFQCI